MKSKLILFILFINCYSYFAQVSELDRYDCNYSKEIYIPFTYSVNQSTSKVQLNQVVFYSYRDQFSYWYKITAMQNDTLYFNISTINDSDSYSVFIYQYNQSDFCSKLYNQKIKAITHVIEAEKGESSQKMNSFIVKKDNIYYLSVLNTSINNCGHQLTLTHQKNDTLTVKALHLPCKKDLASITVSPKKENKLPIINKPVLATNDTVVKQNQPLVLVEKTIEKPIVKENDSLLATTIYNNTFLCKVKDAKTGNPLNSNFSILNTETKDYLELENTETGIWKGIFEQGKTYRIKLSAFGYKDYETETKFDNPYRCELLIHPLNVGDNFIIKSIYFHPNTYALKKSSYNDLQRLLDYLQNNQNVSIEIQGHTNGNNKIFKNKAYENLSEEWNFQGSSKKLSLKRAESIKNYLIGNGVNADRLTPIGFGGDKEIIKNPETMEEGMKNIRVEIKILQN